MQKYTVSHNSTICNLPAFTRGIKKRMDEVNILISDTGQPLDNRVEVLYGFLDATIETDVLNKALGGDDIDEIDLNDMNILYLKISREYDKPVNEFNKPSMDSDTKKMLQDVAAVAKNVETINRISKE